MDKMKSIAGSKKELVRSFLESSFKEGTRNLIQVNLDSLRKFLAPNKPASDILSEAISFASAEHTWRFWSCCCCDRKFGDSDSHMNHFLEQHIETLPDSIEHLIPLPISEEWTEKITEDSWEPFNISTDAAENITSLRRVGIFLLKLLRNGILSESHLAYLSSHCKKLAPESLSNLPSLMKNGVDDNLIMRIRSLDAPQLRGISNYLEEQLAECGLAGKGSSEDDEVLDFPGSRVIGRVLPDHSFSNIFFYADQLRKKSGSEDVESVVSWLYENLDPLDVDAWSKFKYARKAQCVKIHQMLEKEFTNLPRICNEKIKYVKTQDVWKKMEDACTENGENHESLRSVLSRFGEDLSEIPETERDRYRIWVSLALRKIEEADANKCELAGDNDNILWFAVGYE